MYGRLIWLIITLLISGSSYYFYNYFVWRHVDYNNTWVSYYNSWDYEKAIEYYDKAISIKPESAIYNSNKWSALFNLLDYNKALLYFDNAIKYFDEENKDLLNEAELYSYRWASYHKLSQDDKALIDLNKSLEINPEESWWLYYKSSILLDKWDFQWALDYINRYLKIDNSNASAVLIKWYTYYRMWEVDNAIQQYNLSINLDSSDYLWFYYLWEAYIYLEDYDKSLENFKKSFELEPTYYLNAFYIWFSYYKLWDYKNALIYIDKSLVLEWDHNDYWVLLYKLVLLDKLWEKSESIKFFKENFWESKYQISDFIKLTQVFEDDWYESLEFKMKELIKDK